MNTEKKLSSLETIEVLIDTWWNVNERLFVSVVPPISGFNRYMVECECGKIYSEPALGESF